MLENDDRCRIVQDAQKWKLGVFVKKMIFTKFKGRHI
jgi:hypothetical protein